MTAAEIDLCAPILAAAALSRESARRALQEATQ